MYDIFMYKYIVKTNYSPKLSLFTQTSVNSSIIGNIIELRII